MSSFLPVGEEHQQELDAVRNQLSAEEPMPWPTIEDHPLNEYQTQYLATMAFLTLFPDGKGIGVGTGGALEACAPPHFSPKCPFLKIKQWEKCPFLMKKVPL